MTFEEILKSCVSGEMPNVKTYVDYKELKKGTVGKVVSIKKGDGYHGIGVDFPEIKWVVWFYAIPSDDKRTKYMRDLGFI